MPGIKALGKLFFEKKNFATESVACVPALSVNWVPAVCANRKEDNPAQIEVVEQISRRDRSWPGDAGEEWILLRRARRSQCGPRAIEESIFHPR
jgi:hypothetical protein